MKKARFKYGFTLIELMMAITIISFMVITIAVFISQALMGGISFGQSVTALNLARMKMEKTLNLEFSEIENYQSNNYHGTGYQLSRQVDYLPDSSDLVKTVRVEVSGAAGALVSLSMLIADIELPEPDPEPPEPDPEIPVVITKDANPVRRHNARLNSEYDFKDYQSGRLRFCYRPEGGSWVYTSWSNASGQGSYFRQVAPLQPGTTYYFQAQLEYNDTVISGGERSFTTNQ